MLRDDAAAADTAAPPPAAAADRLAAPLAGLRGAPGAAGATCSNPASTPPAPLCALLFFSSRRRHTRWTGDWSSDVCSSDLDGSLINASTDRVAWDRKTGEAVHCCGEAVDGVPTRHTGLSYKFPFGTEKKTYQFFDTTAKKAYPMTYKGSEQLQGLTVYRFEQPVGPVQIAESEVPGNLVGETAPSVTVPRFYDNLRTVWVEPVTGVIVKGQEKQHQVFRDAAGADAVTLVDVTLTFNEKTQRQQADLAKDARSQKAVIGTWAPLALILLGVILLVVGLVLLARRDDDAAEGTGSRRRDPVAV